MRTKTCVYCRKNTQKQNKWIIKSDGTIILLHAIINAVTAGKMLKCHKASWFWNMVILISSISSVNIDTLLRLKRFESLLDFVDRFVAIFDFLAFVDFEIFVEFKNDGNCGDIGGVVEHLSTLVEFLEWDHWDYLITLQNHHVL